MRQAEISFTKKKKTNLKKSKTKLIVSVLALKNLGIMIDLSGIC